LLDIPRSCPSRPRSADEHRTALPPHPDTDGQLSPLVMGKPCVDHVPLGCCASGCPDLSRQGATGPIPTSTRQPRQLALWSACGQHRHNLSACLCTLVATHATAKVPSPILDSWSWPRTDRSGATKPSRALTASGAATSRAWFPQSKRDWPRSAPSNPWMILRLCDLSGVNAVSRDDLRQSDELWWRYPARTCYLICLRLVRRRTVC
jgi:hypothetical protein